MCRVGPEEVWLLKILKLLKRSQVMYSEKKDDPKEPQTTEVFNLLESSLLGSWFPRTQFRVLSHPGTQRLLQSQCEGAWLLLPLTADLGIIRVVCFYWYTENKCGVIKASAQISKEGRGGQARSP